MTLNAPPLSTQLFHETKHPHFYNIETDVAHAASSYAVLMNVLNRDKYDVIIPGKDAIYNSS